MRIAEPARRASVRLRLPVRGRTQRTADFALNDSRQTNRAENSACLVRGWNSWRSMGSSLWGLFQSSTFDSRLKLAHRTAPSTINESPVQVSPAGSRRVLRRSCKRRILFFVKPETLLAWHQKLFFRPTLASHSTFFRACV